MTISKMMRLAPPIFRQQVAAQRSTTTSRLPTKQRSEALKRITKNHRHHASGPPRIPTPYPLGPTVSARFKYTLIPPLLPYHLRPCLRQTLPFAMT
ncbi:hypothetical protein OH77DRAFT_262971 [Trametes cingulata]|nr:hypothetical protein OH77DRAFT_262971 [Trametes cingulata]